MIASNDSTQAAGKQVDWLGDENLFAGWVGLFACGDDQTVTVKDLAGARSTWNGTDKLSREILAPWGHRGDLAEAMPADFVSFVPSYRAVLKAAARPRKGLYEKALGAYSEPAVPEPDASEWSFAAGTGRAVLRSLKPGHASPRDDRHDPSSRPRARATGGSIRDDVQDGFRSLEGRPGCISARSAFTGDDLCQGAGAGFRSAQLHAGQAAARAAAGNQGSEPMPWASRPPGHRRAARPERP